MITLTCGCDVADFDEAESVRWADWDCDSWTGYHPVVCYGEFCPMCSLELKTSGYFIPDDEAETLWLNHERLK